MGGQVTRGVAFGLDEGAVVAQLQQRGLRPQAWANGPGEAYDWHQHGYQKVLYCVSGSIVFHTSDGDLALSQGDLLELPAHTQHAATVGPTGCRCVEAPAHPS